jgi:hypothetical protein
MTLEQQEIDLHPLLAAVFVLQGARQYTQAAQQLARQDAFFYDQIDLETLYTVLVNFPQAWLVTEQTVELASAQTTEITAGLPLALRADLHYLQAQLLRRTGQLPEASWHLTQAQAAYGATEQPHGVIHATLLLARLTHQSEERALAQRYLYEEIQPRLNQQAIKDGALQAHCCLQLADLAREQGAWQRGVNYAQRALTLYADLGHPYGQLLAHLWLATHALNAGDQTAARSHLLHARQQWTEATLGALAEARLLHGELLLACHQGASSAEAFQLAQQYLTVADLEPYCAERIQARLLLGNLYRNRGAYRAAHSWYAETGAVIEQLGYTSYVPQLQAELAWLHLLEGEFSHAHAVVEAHYQQTLPSQRMRLQVVLAVLAMMDGEWEKADRLLQEVITFYAALSDALMVCVLRLYLVYSALHQAKTTQALQQLATALGWLTTQQITAFPHWWHPKILAEVCTYALLSDLYPALVTHMLVHQLEKASLPFLKLLDTSDDIELRRRVRRLQQVIVGISEPLAHLPDNSSKRVIQELLAQGNLCAEAYTELENELMTASNRLNPNPTIIAVLGLYLKGLTRTEIAHELGCSMENVRNYITTIYNHFGLPAYRFRGRTARRQKLIDIAQARGFIY